MAFGGHSRYAGWRYPPGTVVRRPSSQGVRLAPLTPGGHPHWPPEAIPGAARGRYPLPRQAGVAAARTVRRPLSKDPVRGQAEAPGRQGAGRQT